MIHIPRTRSEKLKHLSILGSIPLELVPAMEERDLIRSGNISKRMDPISNIVLRQAPDPESELVGSFCKACATRVFDQTVWEVLLVQASDLFPTLSRVDSAILLKCICAFNAASQSFNMREIVIKLLDKVCKVEKDRAHLGVYSVLYGIQALNVFGHVLDSKTNTRYFNSLLRNLRLGSAESGTLISITQAISARNPQPSPVLLSPLLDEISSRLMAQSGDLDVDSLTGLISAVARLRGSEAQRKLLYLSKEIILKPENEDLVSGFSVEQLSAIAHAYSRMGTAVSCNNADIFTVLGRELSSCTRWSARTLAVTINAFGTAAIAHSDLLEVIRRINLKTISSMDTMQISMAVYGLARLGVLEDFPRFVSRAESLVNSFDVHSTSKLIASLVDTSYGIEKYVEHLVSLVQCESLSLDNIDSVLLTLHSIKSISSISGQRDHLFRGIAKNITKIDFSKLALLLRAYSGTRSDAYRELNYLCFELLKAPTNNLQLTDIINALQSFSTCMRFSHPDSESLRRLIAQRVDDLKNLSYRPITRLAASMARSGICDTDIEAAIEERLKQLRNR